MILGMMMKLGEMLILVNWEEELDRSNTASETIADFYGAPFIDDDEIEKRRQEKEALRLEKINRGRRKREEEERMNQERENELMRNEESQERERIKQKRIAKEE
jgi:membrane protein involved in colicin uptake